MAISENVGFKSGAVGNVYRVSVAASTSNGVHVNTIYLKQKAIPANNDIFQTIHDEWAANIQPSYLACFSSLFSLTSIRIAQIDDDVKGLPSQTLALTGIGQRAVTGDRMPGQLAAIIQFDTGFAGRRGRGRNFLGFLYEADQASGNMDSAVRGIFAAYGTALTTVFGASHPTLLFVVYTKITNSVTPVLTTQVKTPVYTQRRRRAGVGR